MSDVLTPEGYEQSKQKLSELELRRSRLADRVELNDAHLVEARRSYDRMIGQYRREIKLYEAVHPKTAAK
jgi:hypothetical protein